MGAAAIGERSRAALAHLRACSRRYSGRPPYGYRFGPDGRLLRDRAEHRVRQRIEALRAKGLTLRGIAATLAAEGVLARSGRPFAPSTLLGLVREGPVTNKATAS